MLFASFFPTAFVLSLPDMDGVRALVLWDLSIWYLTPFLKFLNSTQRLLENRGQLPARVCARAQCEPREMLNSELA